ncbi:MAG: ATP-binding cassette domain-containing protein [Shimia sp.]|uniref:ATP-binding cassette domain-containing protein n=1 Tax=Shimia sp. TaxID=1954381 RepID=UPI004057F773
MSSPNIGQLKRLSVPLVALSLITNLAILVNPIFMMQVLDRVVPTGNLHTLAMLLAVALAALVLQAMVEYLRDVSFHRAAHWLERASLPAVLARPSDARDELMADRSQLSNALSGGAAVTALMLPWIPLFLLVLWIIHPWFLALALGLVALTATVRLAGDSLLGGVRSQHAQLLQQEATTLRDAEMVIAGSGMPGVFRNMLDRFSATLSRRLSVAEQMTRPTVATTCLSSFLRGATQLLGLSLGAALVVFGDLSAGGMIAASLILARSVANVEQVLIQWPQMITARSAFHRLEAIADIATASATEIPGLSGALSCKGLIFPRGGGAPPRLEKISFALPPGSCLAVVGSSGGGKTTLLEALSGVAPCPIGSVLLEETDIKTLPVPSLAAHVGYLPQHAHLFHGTLAENISGFSPDADSTCIVAAAKTAGVHGLISALPQSYDTDIGSQPHLLSAGQKQRVALARAIYHSPRYLFLDEPNALLDAAGERQLCATLARLKKMETTIVMVIHRSGLMGLADYVLALEQGRMVDFGPRTEVLERMHAGRRRIELPLIETSLQDLTDLVGAQFVRCGDADLSKKPNASRLKFSISPWPTAQRRSYAPPVSIFGSSTKTAAKSR